VEKEKKRTSYRPPKTQVQAVEHLRVHVDDVAHADDADDAHDRPTVFQPQEAPSHHLQPHRLMQKGQPNPTEHSDHQVLPAPKLPVAAVETQHHPLRSKTEPQTLPLLPVLVRSVLLPPGLRLLLNLRLLSLPPRHQQSSQDPTKSTMKGVVAVAVAAPVMKPAMQDPVRAKLSTRNSSSTMNPLRI